MLNFRTVSRIYYFLTTIYLGFSFNPTFPSLFRILFIGFGILQIYKGWLMHQNLQQSRDKMNLNMTDVKRCKRYMTCQFLLAAISLAFVFIPHSSISIISYLCISTVLDICVYAPLKNIFETNF